MENLIQDLLNASFSRLIGQFNNNQAGSTEIEPLVELTNSNHSETLQTGSIDSSDIATKQQLIPQNQWISGVVNRAEISRHNADLFDLNLYLNKILGPLAGDKKSTYTKLDNEVMEALAAIQQNQDDSSQSYHELILKIDKKVFIESIDFYQKATDEPSSIMKISINDETNTAKWLTVYESTIPIPVQSLLQLFSPKLLATSVKSDTIKLSILGDIQTLDAIEVKGSIYQSDLVTENIDKPIDPFHDYQLFAKQLHSLINSDMFSDIMFEVEGKIVPAHKNILVSRSEYFRAMLSEKSRFLEATSKTGTTNKTPIIYVGDITYEIFIQVLNFIYTGHVDSKNFPHHVAIKVMRAADKMNLVELEKLCIKHMSFMINQENVCKIYEEIHEKKPIVESLLQICHDEISSKFAYISGTDSFCSLPQDLMIKVMENVVPKLCRITSVQVNQLDGTEAIEIQPSNERTIGSGSEESVDSDITYINLY